jgi:uncharacterized membrane protein
MASQKQARAGGQGRTKGRGQGQGGSGSSRQGGSGRPGQARTTQASRGGAGTGPGGGRPGGTSKTGPGRPDTGSPARAAAQAAAAPAETADNATDPRWFRLTTLILSLLGLGLSVYLTITHYTDSAPAGCPVNSVVNCAKVTTSPESMIFGVFPVAVLGLAFYVFMVAVNSPWSWRPGMPLIRIARLAGVLTGIVFVLYLVYVELIQVDAICEYCTGVHLITFALFGLVMYSTAARGLSGNGPGRPVAAAR